MLETVVIGSSDIGLAEAVKKKLAEEKKHVNLISCEDGFQAIRKIRSKKPVVVLVEDMLPRVDGYKLCRLIKFDRKFRQVVMFVLSEDPSERTQTLAKEMGAEDVIRPRPDQIIAKVSVYLQE